MTGLTYIVVCQAAWCNSSGYGVDYGWDGSVFFSREQAKRHGFQTRGSDDFNIGVLLGEYLISFDWMSKPVGEDVETMRLIARELDLKFSLKVQRAGRAALTKEGE